MRQEDSQKLKCNNREIGQLCLKAYFTPFGQPVFKKSLTILFDQVLFVMVEFGSYQTLLLCWTATRLKCLLLPYMSLGHNETALAYKSLWPLSLKLLYFQNNCQPITTAYNRKPYSVKNYWSFNHYHRKREVTSSKNINLLYSMWVQQSFISILWYKMYKGTAVVV